jgi:hypothetical protein
VHEVGGVFGGEASGGGGWELGEAV